MMQNGRSLVYAKLFDFDGEGLSPSERPPRRGLVNNGDAGRSFHPMVITLALTFMLLITFPVAYAKEIIPVEGAPGMGSDQRVRDPFEGEMCRGEDGNNVLCSISRERYGMAASLESDWIVGSGGRSGMTCAYSPSTGWEHCENSTHIVECVNKTCDTEVITPPKPKRSLGTGFDAYRGHGTYFLSRVKATNYQNYLSATVTKYDFWNDETCVQASYCNQYQWCGDDDISCDTGFHYSLAGFQSSTSGSYSGTTRQNKWCTTGVATRHAIPYAEEVSRITFNHVWSSALLFIYKDPTIRAGGSVRVTQPSRSCISAGASFGAGSVTWQCPAPPPQCVETSSGYACTHPSIGHWDFKYHAIGDSNQL